MNLSEAEELFGLEGEYSASDIRSVYKQLAKIYHPDLSEDSRTANYFMRQINEACELLERASSSSTNQTKQSTKSEHANGYRRASDSREERQAEERKGEEAKTRKERETAKREEDYLAACALAQTATTASEHARVAHLFEKLGYYKDARSFYEFHSRIADEMRDNEERAVSEKVEKEHKRKWALNVASGFSVTPPALLGLFIVSTLKDNSLFPICLILFGVSAICGLWGAFHEEHDRVAEIGLVSSMFSAFTMYSILSPIFLMLLAQVVGSISNMCDAFYNDRVVAKTITAILAYGLFIIGVISYYSRG